MLRPSSSSGGWTPPRIIDALILQHEADRLGIPADKDIAIRWLRSVDSGLSTTRFDEIYRRNFSSEITDLQLLEELANQMRLAQVRNLPGLPTVTPLDVYQTYRDQNETISAKLVPFRVEDYLGEVPQPSAAEVEAYFQKYKGQLPDPIRETPGFMVPQRVMVEYVSADIDDLAEGLKSRLGDEDLRPYYERNRDRFFITPSELPEDLFAGEPERTPSLRDPFVEVRDQVVDALARERAEDNVAEKFDAVEAAIGSLADEYFEAKDVAEQDGKPVVPPRAGDVMETAAREEGLTYERTPLMDRELTEALGPDHATSTDTGWRDILSATIGGGPFDPGTTFSEEFFGTNRGLFETVQMSSGDGQEFLAWKIKDEPARVPGLDEVRDQVVLAWRMEQAREKAAAAARAVRPESSRCSGKCRPGRRDGEQIGDRHRAGFPDGPRSAQSHEHDHAGSNLAPIRSGKSPMPVTRSATPISASVPIPA